MLLLDQYFVSRPPNFGRYTKPWKPERLAKLIELCKDESLSASKIAAIMGISRNAVIGKCRRNNIPLPGRLYGSLGLDLSPDGQRARQNELRRLRRQRERAGGIKRKYNFKLGPGKSLSAICPDDLPRVSFMDLSKSNCHWPYGDGREMSFCGQPAEAGHSYCTYHCCIAYKPMEQRLVGKPKAYSRSERAA